MRKMHAAGLAIVFTAACASLQPVTSEIGRTSQSRTREAEDSLQVYWRRATLDTNVLSSLADFTGQFGAAGARVLMRVAEDTTEPHAKRQYALWSLTGFWGRWDPRCAPFPWSDGWRPLGVTECRNPAQRPERAGGGAPDSASSLSSALRVTSVRPEMRDTIRASLMRLEREQSGVGRAARAVLYLQNSFENWDDATRVQCARLATAIGVATEFMDAVDISYQALMLLPPAEQALAVGKCLMIPPDSASPIKMA